MKSKIIKRITGICSVGLAGILVFFAVHDAVLTASAEETLFGIENLIQQMQNREEPYTILEIVPDDAAAEIGYLMPGNEPAISERQENGEWQSWQEGLRQYKTAPERIDYMADLAAKLEAFYNAKGFTRDNAPVYYLGYEESIEPQDGFKELDFDTEVRRGYFQAYTGGDVPRYTLEFTFAGMMDDLEITTNQDTEYYYAEAKELTSDMFESLPDETILYENRVSENKQEFIPVGSWGDLKATVSGSDAANMDLASTVSEGDLVDNISPYAEGEGDLADGMSPYTEGEEGLTDDISLYVEGEGDLTDGMSPYAEDEEGLTDDISLYAEGDGKPTGYYLITSYVRWQQGMEPELQFRGLYFVSKETLSNEGAYEFVDVEDENEIAFEYTFTTDRIYYKGGFVNNEWFRRHVINLETEQLEAFPVKVITLTPAELNSMEGIPYYDMLYLNSGISEDKSYEGNNDLSEGMRRALFEGTVANGKPCIVDASVLYNGANGSGIVINDSLKNTQIFYLCALFSQNSPIEFYENHYVGQVADETVDRLLEGMVTDADRNFVTEQTYSFFAPSTLINANFSVPNIYREGEVIEEGFAEVLNEILSENLNREADTSGEYKPLSTDISEARVIRHIINYQNRRKIEVKKNIRVLDIEPALSDAGSYELTEEDIKRWAPEVETVTIDRMTTAEFIGRIEDINEEYDLVYIGTDKDHLNTSSTGSTLFNDSSMDSLIYFHTGDLRYGGMELSGQLDTEYVGRNRANNVYYYVPVRYGGNDITLEKKNAMLSFLGASYPIIVSDEFFYTAATVYQDGDYRGYSADLKPGEYNLAALNAMGVGNDDISSIKVREGYQVILYADDNFQGNSRVIAGGTSVSFLDGGWNDQASSIRVEAIEGADHTRQINEDHIDNCSYMYEFAKAAMEKTNFYAREDIGDDSGMFKFYLNRPKASMSNVTANGTLNANGVYEIYPGGDGRYILEYKFTIVNEGAASADTRYRCQLYIDVNADGKYSNNEELGDITLTQNGNAVSADNLYAGREYVLRRYVPDGYKGVLPWKIQVSQVNNSNIHNGITGYTKLRGLERETLKVLQICRDKVLDPAWWGGANEVLFDLGKRIADPGDIYHVLIYGGTYEGVTYEGIYDDFDIDVTFMTISEFHNAYYENENVLDDYNMLILGFSDAYGNIEGNETTGPIGAIVSFIKSGKSVLFAHDTVSYFNYEQGKVGVTNHYNTGETRLTDQYHNSYNLTRAIRGLVGMDIYGITAYDRLKTGDGLDVNSPEWQNLQNLNKDIAYVPKSNRTQSYGLTQGYTYSIINGKDKFSLKKTPDAWGDFFTAAETGLQNGFTNKYLNLYYGEVHYFDANEGDRSWDYGEIPANYNGETSNLYVTKVNSGQITDYPYKLADEFQVSTTHNQYYQLDFMADDDKDNQSDLVVWYCLGYRKTNGGERQETIYSVSPNDVSNNYYIYNKGNITYTGMGHAGNTSTVEEAKLFINTIIASYNAGIKDPTITFLSDGSGNAREISSIYSYYDEENILTFEETGSTHFEDPDYAKVYFSVNDLNFVKGSRKIALNCYYEDNGEGSQAIVCDGKQVNVKPLDVKIYDAATGTHVADSGSLLSGGVYYIKVPRELINQDSTARYSIYFEAQSTIESYGTERKTGKTYKRFDFIKVFLFDLQ